MSILGYNEEERIHYPLSHPQKRIWYTENVYPNTSLYNIGGTVRSKEPLNLKLLGKAIEIFIKRNEGVKLQLTEDKGQVSQYINKIDSYKPDFYDFSKSTNPEKEFADWLRSEAEKPFELKNSKLFYFALFKISENDQGYFAKFHHIIADGWSVNIMTNQICESYTKLLNGEEFQDVEEYKYHDYISQEKKYLSSNRFLKDKVFWHNI